MCLFSGTSSGFRAGILLIVVISGLACNQHAGRPDGMERGDENVSAPLQIAFQPLMASFTLSVEDKEAPSCAIPAGREHVYDPKAGVFHVHFKSQDFRRSGFEVTKVAERFTRPVVFRLTGDTRGGGCLGRDLTLSVDGKDYSLEESVLSHDRPDKTSFRVERQDDVVTIEFTKKGEALLKPGAQVWLMVDTGW